MVQQLTAADRKLISLYGDTIHQNDGCHLHGGIDPDISIQHQVWWVQVIATHLFLWDLPNWKLGNDFLDILNGLFKDVLARKHNMEMPLLFIACILSCHLDVYLMLYNPFAVAAVNQFRHQEFQPRWNGIMTLQIDD
jgi:hypothetical protein